MKKIISIMLAVLMLASLFALASCAGCNDGETGDPEQTNPDGTPVESVEFQAVNENVYASAAVNVRSSTSAENNENVVGQVKAGTQLVRIGYHTEWSKVIYNNQECYIKSAYLTTEQSEVETDAPVVDSDKFTDVNNQTMYAYYDDDEDGVCDENATINLRAEASTSATIKYTLPRGTTIVRTGVSYDNGTDGAGWSRVVYNGETVYCRNSCLSETNPGPGNTTTTTAAVADTTTAE